MLVKLIRQGRTKTTVFPDGKSESVAIPRMTHEFEVNLNGFDRISDRVKAAWVKESVRSGNIVLVGCPFKVEEDTEIIVEVQGEKDNRENP